MWSTSTSAGQSGARTLISRRLQLTTPRVTYYRPSSLPSPATQDDDDEDVAFSTVVAPPSHPASSSRDEGHPSLYSPHDFSQQHSPSASSSAVNHLSMPVDLLAVNAGISPQLTGGMPSPDAMDAPETEMSMQEESEQAKQVVPTPAPAPVVEATPPASARPSRESSRSGSRTRRAPIKSSSAPPPPPPPTTSTSSTSSRKPPSTSTSTTSLASLGALPPLPSTIPQPSVGAITNLVTKDAVIASSILTSLILPPRAGSSQPMELLVLGVPTVGAKSRVETQIKITLVLVAAKAGAKAAKTLTGERFILPDGGLAPEASGQYARVGGWTHLQLPRLLAIKKKGKKVPMEGKSRSASRGLRSQLC